MAEIEKDRKLKRRTAKARFTRYGNNLDTLMKSEESVSEIQTAYDKYAQSFQEVESTHEEYTELLDDDKFAEEETWMDEIQSKFTQLSLLFKKHVCKAQEVSAYKSPAADATTSQDKGAGSSADGASSMQFKLERIKLPKFKGDVRDYHVFKSDFKHMVRSCSSRDAIALLRTCLDGKPAEMIRGIGDYGEAWDFLDSIYGDRRFIADAIINDINTFRQLKDGEDSRFCELVHLIRHSYKTLEEVGRPEDMDNSQMLALIERKLNHDDRKVWFRYLETTKKEVSLSILLDWMNTEMRCRIRATAPVRCSSSSHSSKPKASIHHMKSQQQTEYTFHKCWLCESSTHWIDQCQKLISMTQPERLALMKEQHACFSCLKRAGRDHRMTNCKRKRQCSEMNGGTQCRYYHHPLLHSSAEQTPPNNAKSNVAFVTDKEALLPVLTAKLIGQNGSRQGNVLLDSGSQISIIRQSVADDLNLTGRNISVSITKVGGEEEQIQTRLFKVPVKPMTSNQKYVISAIGLPCISDAVAEVSVTEEAKQLKIDQKELHRSSGPIDLLIGMDHMSMHVGETRKAVNCAARNSPLGWVIFGGSASNSQPRTTVLHAKVTTIELSDFWTTESMGVRSPSCECDTGRMSPIEKTEYDVIKDSCTKTGDQWTVSYPWRKDPDLLPDNQSQVKHMLTATEKRLQRNPEHAAAYQQQMQEMVDLGFARELTQERWRNGPEFLYDPEECWPQEPTVDRSDDESEKRKVNVNVAEVAEANPDIINCEKFSKWRRLIRVTAYVLRFIKNLKARCCGSKRAESKQLLPEELTEAEHYWVKKAQRPLHDGMKKGEFKTLSPFIQGELIRVGGRVGEGLISYDQRHPVLLPQSHHISKLIVDSVHEQGHEGVACTAAKVRQRYWILGVHRVAKSVKHRCVVCRKKEHKLESQFMAELPYLRMALFTPPFYYTSVDYFGPFHVRVGRNKTTKHYGVIFTCLNTSAVHLDLAVDCSTMEFLQVLRRFMAIRGQPSVIVSDNGTQFVGAEKELRAMVEGWNKDELRDFCAERNTEWRFVTPSAPHQNGCAEALVKSCKIAIHKAVGSQVLTPFELLTCLTDVANLVNQRPIGRIPNDPDDGRYLSPNDILLGRASNTTPQGPFRSSQNPRHRVEFVQKIVDSFWKCWHRDVFPLLVPRRKWNTEKRNIRVDDVVMISDHNAVRGKWTIGRVIHVYPGSDGRIRNIKIKTVDSELRRPSNKIVVIYPAEGYED